MLLLSCPSGRDITDYIKGRGLQPKEKFLDFGSGALRNGIWLIKYLDTGNYYGIEHNTSMFEAGRDYELVLNGLQVCLCLALKKFSKKRREFFSSSPPPSLLGIPLEEKNLHTGIRIFLTPPLGYRKQGGDKFAKWTPCVLGMAKGATGDPGTHNEMSS